MRPTLLALALLAVACAGDEPSYHSPVGVWHQTLQDGNQITGFYMCLMVSPELRVTGQAVMDSGHAVAYLPLMGSYYDGELAVVAGYNPQTLREEWRWFGVLESHDRAVGTIDLGWARGEFPWDRTGDDPVVDCP